MKDESSISCGLCGRPFSRKELTRHHCLPRQKGGAAHDIALICRQCHSMLHVTYTNATLAALYPTIEQLRQALELATYIRWVRRQPPSRRTRNARRRRRV